MKGRHLRRRFSLQPSFMKDDNSDDKKRDKVNRHDAVDDSMNPSNVRHKIVVMGSAKVGKTSIITQFLYNRFSSKYKRTVEEMHQGNFSISGVNLILDILDTSGSYEDQETADIAIETLKSEATKENRPIQPKVYLIGTLENCVAVVLVNELRFIFSDPLEAFPAMRALSISSADAFILVYEVTDATTFEEVRAIRDQIHEIKGTTAVPIVIVGNKNDLVEDDTKLREVENEMTESVVTVDWENGFVEASALKNENVTQIFKELLSQAKITYNLSPALRRRRRQSLPQQVGNNGGTPSISAPASATHVPSAAQLQHLQRIQENSLGGKRNSCTIS